MKKTKLFLDSGNLKEILDNSYLVEGFTTNPSLLKKSGVLDYETFARNLLSEIKNKPVSLEVFSDDFHEQWREAKIIASWGTNVYVKIPITNIRGQSSAELINDLLKTGIMVNVTAVLDPDQILDLPINKTSKMIVSVFAGRIADTGKNPIPLMKLARKYCKGKNAELLWASPREVLNIYQAKSIADIITCSSDLLKKYNDLNKKDLKQFSLETIKQFYDDAQIFKPL